MWVVGVVCLLLAVAVLRSKRPAQAPNASRLYRIDNRVVASTLILMAAVCFYLSFGS